MKRIIVDIDDTLFDFSGKVMGWKDPREVEDDYIRLSKRDNYYFVPQEDINKYINDRNFYQEDVFLNESLIEFLDENKDRYHIVIVSAGLGAEDSPINKSKEQFINEKFPNYDYFIVKNHMEKTNYISIHSETYIFDDRLDSYKYALEMTPSSIYIFTNDSGYNKELIDRGSAFNSNKKIITYDSLMLIPSKFDIISEFETIRRNY